VYKLNRRVEIKRYTTAANAFGGLSAVQTGAWYKWADVFDRTGGSNRDYQQLKWDYTHTIVMRYEKERQLRSNDIIFYELIPYKINNISIKTEAGKAWEIVSCTKIDENINSEAPMDTDTIQVYNYIAAGGEYAFEVPQLIGKTLFGAFKDGIQYMDNGSLPINGKEIFFNSTEGSVTWSTYFEDGEVATILYY